MFQGQSEALCIDGTLYDLVIGNIDGSKLPDMSHFSVGIVTIAQVKQDDKAYRKLKASDHILSENKQAFQDAQCPTPSWKIRRKADSGVVTKSCGLNRGETRIIKRRDLLYRQCTQRNKTLQLIVPSSCREKVFKLAHELLMAGHLGIRNFITELWLSSFIQGPVVQSVVSLTSSLRVISLTVLADSMYNILIFFAEKM